MAFELDPLSAGQVATNDNAFDGAASVAEAPGKRTRTQGMGPSIDRIADRVATVLQRRAASDGGGAAGAEAAVTQAAGSTGAPLPGAIRERFEGSLGADLSSVRVHTGADSASAADAVGAQAYATGNDIHFAPGKYQPDDPFGVHLLAHEVAHTVQQSGGRAPARQHKLEISDPGDAHELEADRAADAMVTGQPFKVGAGNPLLSRSPTMTGFGGFADPADPIKDARSLMPAPCNWSREVEGVEITGPWQGQPAFLPLQFPPGVAGQGATMLVDAGKKKFTSDWTSMQALYNGVSTEMSAHQNAATSAQKLGLVDVAVAGTGNLEANVARTKLPGTQNTIGQAFNPDNSLGGSQNPDSKLTRDESVKLDKAKKDIESKTELAVTKSETAISQQNNLASRGRDLQNAMLDRDAISEDSEKEQLEREMAAMAKAATLINDCIGAASETVGAEKPEAGILKGTTGAMKIINTLLWDGEIAKIQGQLAFISGKMTSIKKTKAFNAIQNAKGAVENAARDVKAAHREYNIAMRERTVAFQELASQMQNAATKSGASEGDANKIAAAVQAVPAIELLVDSASKVATMIVVPACDSDSANGCGASTIATQQTMTAKRSDLAQTKRNMEQTTTTWKLRLAAVHALVGKAR